MKQFANQINFNFKGIQCSLSLWIEQCLRAIIRKSDNLVNIRFISAECAQRPQLANEGIEFYFGASFKSNEYDCLKLKINIIFLTFFYRFSSTFWFRHAMDKKRNFLGQFHWSHTIPNSIRRILNCNKNCDCIHYLRLLFNRVILLIIESMFFVKRGR